MSQWPVEKKFKNILEAVELGVDERVKFALRINTLCKGNARNIGGRYIINDTIAILNADNLACIGLSAQACGESNRHNGCCKIFHIL